LRARAFDAAPAAGGEINGAPFAWIADADMRLGPALEIIVNGKYYWLPFTAIDTLRMEAPADLRDTVWMPGNLTLRNGGEVVALVPTRYAGTTPSTDSALLLARATDWTDRGADTFVGTGQRLLSTDAGDTALMDLRALRMFAPGGG
jgi:type VI secretion system protein ImpE